MHAEMVWQSKIGMAWPGEMDFFQPFHKYELFIVI